MMPLAKAIQDAASPADIAQAFLAHDGERLDDKQREHLQAATSGKLVRLMRGIEVAFEVRDLSTEEAPAVWRKERAALLRDAKAGELRSALQLNEGSVWAHMPGMALHVSEANFEFLTSEVLPMVVDMNRTALCMFTGLPKLRDAGVALVSDEPGVLQLDTLWTVLRSRTASAATVCAWKCAELRELANNKFRPRLVCSLEGERFSVALQLKNGRVLSPADCLR